MLNNSRIKMHYIIEKLKKLYIVQNKYIYVHDDIKSAEQFKSLKNCSNPKKLIASWFMQIGLNVESYFKTLISFNFTLLKNPFINSTELNPQELREEKQGL